MAVDANWANNGAHPNLALLQCDMVRLPFAPRGFDKVICLGVIQHTPDPRKAFASLAEMVRPRGELVIDVYAKTLAALLQWKYLLRPITGYIPRQRLYRAIEWGVPPLIPLARALRGLAGRAGARLVPIVEYSHLGLTPDHNREWAILDTFDMYSRAYDYPQSVRAVRQWFAQEGFGEIRVGRGPNGVIGRGRKD